MSQHWHGHWTEVTFAPKKLRNWEVPKWYPTLPDRHCVITKFITNDNGHILDNTKKAKHSPWGTYKDTWDLPKRITRSMAIELSMTPQYTKDIWELHKKKHSNLCNKTKQAKKKEKNEVMDEGMKKGKKEEIKEEKKKETKEEKKEEKEETKEEKKKEIKLEMKEEKKDMDLLNDATKRQQIDESCKSDIKAEILEDKRPMSV